MVKITVPMDLKSGKNGKTVLELDAQAFIFDKDGTLLTHDHFVPIMKKRVELISSDHQLSKADSDTLSRVLGLDPETDEILNGGTMFIARADTKLLVEAFLGERGFRGSEARKYVEEVFNSADEQIDLAEHIHPYPGVPELLASIKSHGAKIAIATHDTTAAAKRQLEVAKLDEYIDLIIGLDYATNIVHKPSPSMLQAACERFEISPDEAVVVGDSKNDVLMGVRGGAGISIGVLTGEHTVEDFQEFDSLISAVTEIKIID